MQFSQIVVCVSSKVVYYMNSYSRTTFPNGSRLYPQLIPGLVFMKNLIPSLKLKVKYNPYNLGFKLYI